jgi:hypothetical protein
MELPMRRIPRDRYPYLPGDPDPVLNPLSEDLHAIWETARNPTRWPSSLGLSRVPEPEFISAFSVPPNATEPRPAVFSPGMIVDSPREAVDRGEYNGWPTDALLRELASDNIREAAQPLAQSQGLGSEDVTSATHPGELETAFAPVEDPETNDEATAAQNAQDYRDPRWRRVKVGRVPGGLWRAYQIGEEVRARTDDLARDETTDPVAWDRLTRNGRLDAWRHAEWSRRMAQELGYQDAWIAGMGHELTGLAGQALDTVRYMGKPPVPWGKRLEETLMDLQNNELGRLAGSTPISTYDPRLVYGPGGPLGPPPDDFDEYIDRTRERWRR